MKKNVDFSAALVAMGVLAGGVLVDGSAEARGRYPGVPLATANPPSGYAVTYPLTGNETIAADTNLVQTLPNGVVTGSIMPQTELISTSQLQAFVLGSPSIGISLPALADSAVSTPSAGVTVYYSTTGGKLSFKDSSGVVHTITSN